MAQFKVGQRVRVVQPKSAVYGHEGTVLRLAYNERVTTLWDGVSRVEPVVIAVALDSCGAMWGDWPIGFPPCDLAPLTDPKASEFIEKLKKLGQEPVLPRTPVFFGD